MCVLRACVCVVYMCVRGCVCLFVIVTLVCHKFKISIKRIKKKKRRDHSEASDALPFCLGLGQLVEHFTELVVGPPPQHRISFGCFIELFKGESMPTPKPVVSHPTTVT